MNANVFILFWYVYVFSKASLDYILVLVVDMNLRTALIDDPGPCDCKDIRIRNELGSLGGPGRL